MGNYRSINEKYKKNVAKFLISKRKEMKMSQYDISEKLGVSQGVISRTEKEETFLDLSTLISLSELFDSSLDDVIGFKKNNDKDEERLFYIKYGDINKLSEDDKSILNVIIKRMIKK